MSFHRSQAAFLQVPMAPLPQRTVDRIIDRRTSGEIIAAMERRVASPEYAAERAAFYAARAERDRADWRRREINWAFEAMALEMLGEETC
jgi:hypothetical protein